MFSLCNNFLSCVVENLNMEEVHDQVASVHKIEYVWSS